MPPLRLITAAVPTTDNSLPTIALRSDRQRLAKRLWRGVAEDGTEFGFELEKPLQPGDTFHQTATARYAIVQEPEALLAVSLAELPASAVAGIGWAVGNLHLELSSEATRLLTPDEPAARQLFARIQIEFTTVTDVFRPGRFKRHVASDDLGSSHRH